MTRPTFETTPLFVISTLTSSWGIFRHDPLTGSIQTVVPPSAAIADAIIEEGEATSKDGTGVRYHLVRKTSAGTGPLPTLIMAYGAYNRPFVPEYPGPMSTIVEAGGLFVHAHIRGGSEFGRRWWLGGRAQHKQNSYDDLYAVATDLIDKGLTIPARLGVVGKSNGGMMAGVAATQRPDLWAVAVPLVPILDLVGFMNQGYLHGSTEHGDEADADDVQRIVRTSPYTAIKADVVYPAILAVAGDTDPRCPPWHASKFIARMQSENAASKNPILLRIHANEGHGAAASSEVRVRSNSEWLIFALHQLGLGDLQSSCA